MMNNTSTLATKGTKSLFTDVMKLPVASRKVFIEQYTPNMQAWQKEASLKKTH